MLFNKKQFYLGNKNNKILRDKAIAIAKIMHKSKFNKVDLSSLSLIALDI